VWAPGSDSTIDDLDGAGTAVWFGRDLLAAAFADGSGLYDVAARTRLRRAPALPRPPASAPYVDPGGTRTYYSVVSNDPRTGVDCELRTYDPFRRRRVAPTIELAATSSDECLLGSTSATADGRRIVVTSGETTSGDFGARTTTVYDGRTGERIAGPVHGAVVSEVSPDGTLVGVNGTGAITQYDLDTLRPVGTFPSMRAFVLQLGFSADGATLAVGALNGTLAVYDVATRTRLGDPIATDGSPIPVDSLRPDGGAVAVNTSRGVAVWDLDPERLAAAACELAGRDLTRREWDTYLGDAGEYRATCAAS
jgi:hypothetical protein